MLKHLALVLFGVLMGLALLEGALRATGWVLLNARGSASALAPREPGIRRVLCLGESTTADLEIGATGSYPVALQQFLDSRAGGRSRFVVINGGVPATTTDRIVEGLEANLQRSQPDVVVTMMGINDGASSDPLFPVGDSLRVVKLARMLAFSVATQWAGGAPEPAVASIPRSDGLPALGIPMGRTISLVYATGRLLAGDFDAAERRLQRLAAGVDDADAGVRFAAAKAVGALMLLSEQRHRDADVARYGAQFHQFVELRKNPSTERNYRTLQRIVHAHGLPLVAVQYPGRALAPLEEMLRGTDGVTFVDNQATFRQRVRTAPASTIYRDLFAGDFGHLTKVANLLLASNVATGVMQALGIPSSQRGPATP